MKINSIFFQFPAIRRKIAAISLISTMCVGNSFAGVAWSPEAFDIGTKIIKVLLSRGICDDENDCIKKEYVFSSGGSSGINVQVYGVKDKDVISEIIKICTDKYFYGQRKSNIKVDFYVLSHKESMNSSYFFRQSSFMELTFKGEE
jgi:hypothetical protein